MHSGRSVSTVSVRRQNQVSHDQEHSSISVIFSQCWCVDMSTGIEEIGTRMFTIGLHPPDCSNPKMCAVQCHESRCPYGVRTDGSGCPANGICECNNICSVGCNSIHRTTRKYSVIQLSFEQGMRPATGRMHFESLSGCAILC